MGNSFSIALATCNGARHLPELLDSIAKQRQPPIQLVASDDASEDDSLALIESFAASAPFQVRILRNKQRLGVNRNFSRAIAACTGDFISLADQDDVWRQDKLEKLAKALKTPGVLAAFSNARIVGPYLIPLGYSMWQRVKFTQREQVRLKNTNGFDVLLKHHIVTGATMAFNASLNDIALPIPSGWPHDAWFAMIAAAQGRLVSVPEPLINYRQHENNVVGGRRKSFGQEAREALVLDRGTWYREEQARWRELAERLAGCSTPPSAHAALAEKLLHLESRASLPPSRWRRIPGILRELVSGRYARNARNWGSIAIDLLVK